MCLSAFRILSHTQRRTVDVVEQYNRNSRTDLDSIIRVRFSIIQVMKLTSVSDQPAANFWSLSIRRQPDFPSDSVPRLKAHR